MVRVRDDATIRLRMGPSVLGPKVLGLLDCIVLIAFKRRL